MQINFLGEMWHRIRSRCRFRSRSHSGRIGCSRLASARLSPGTNSGHFVTNCHLLEYCALALTNPTEIRKEALLNWNRSKGPPLCVHLRNSLTFKNSPSSKRPCFPPSLFKFFITFSKLSNILYKAFAFFYLMRHVFFLSGAKNFGTRANHNHLYTFCSKSRLHLELPINVPTDITPQPKCLVPQQTHIFCILLLSKTRLRKSSKFRTLTYKHINIYMLKIQNTWNTSSKVICLATTIFRSKNRF